MTDHYPKKRMNDRPRSEEDRRWTVIVHGSLAFSLLTGCGLIGPVIMILALGRKTPCAYRTARQALLASGVLFVLMLMMLLLPGSGMLGFVMVLHAALIAAAVLGAIRSSNGQSFSYPVVGWVMK